MLALPATTCALLPWLGRMYRSEKLVLATGAMASSMNVPA
jgi:hypothetical protein